MPSFIHGSGTRSSFTNPALLVLRRARQDLVQYLNVRAIRAEILVKILERDSARMQLGRGRGVDISRVAFATRDRQTRGARAS